MLPYTRQQACDFWRGVAESVGRGERIVLVADTPEHFFEEIKAEYAVYKDVVQKQNLTMD
jgi:hypothetical protein